MRFIRMKHLLFALVIANAIAGVNDLYEIKCHRLLCNNVVNDTGIVKVVYTFYQYG